MKTVLCFKGTNKDFGKLLYYIDVLLEDMKRYDNKLKDVIK